MYCKGLGLQLIKPQRSEDRGGLINLVTNLVGHNILFLRRTKTLDHPLQYY